MGALDVRSDIYILSIEGKALGNNEKKNNETIFKVFREFCAIIVWAYLICKIAIFDFDFYIIDKYSPKLINILYYKIFLFAGIVSILWFILGKKRFPQLVLYVSTYPLIILIWKIPKAMFKNWSITIVFAPALFEFLTKFKTYFIMSTIVAISALFILTSQNKILLFVSMLTLITFLIFHLYSSFRKAYRSTIFSKLHVIITKIKSKICDTSFFKEILDKSLKTNKPETEQEKLQTQLSTLYIFYWGAEFLRDKVDHFFKSRKMDLYLIFTWFWTVLVTVIIYSFEYLGLYKILPNSFKTPFTPNFFSFLGFSFGKLAPSSVSLISPVSLSAILLCYSELACTFVIFIILVFTILTAARERYKEDIYNIVKEVAEVAAIIQGNFNIIFNMTLSDVEYLLLTQNKSLVNSLRKLRGLPELDYVQSESVIVTEKEKNIEGPNDANAADAKKQRG